MPIQAPTPVTPAAPAVVAFIAALPGVTVAVGGCPAGAPTSGLVVAWAQVSDAAAPGGVRLDPVFVATGRAWTPDQFRAIYGPQGTFTVAVP